MCIDKALIERLWLRFAFCFRCFAAVSWLSTVSQLLMKRRVSVSGTTTNTCFIPSSEHIDLHNSCFIVMNSCWIRCLHSWRASRNNNHRQQTWMRNSTWCQHWQVFANWFNICETDHRQYSTSGVVVNQALWERYCHGERGSAILSNGSGKFALFSSLYGENSVNHTFLWCISPILKVST